MGQKVKLISEGNIHVVSTARPLASTRRDVGTVTQDTRL
jgi:hypothetical protein